MKNVLITGGSSGIGKSCVCEFSKLGYRVLFTYNNSHDSALKISEQTGAIPIKCDITSSVEVNNMAKYIHENYGKIYVLVNNAGIAQQKLFTDITEEDWDIMFDTNIKGMFLVTKAFLPDMIHQKQGKIINISSMWGIVGGSCEVHYSASKSAIIGFTKALAKEVGPCSINVNCIAPGVIDTKMNEHLDSDTMNDLKNETPLMRLGTPYDVARTTVFLSQDDASFITGQVIGVDGGII